MRKKKLKTKFYIIYFVGIFSLLCIVAVYLVINKNNIENSDKRGMVTLSFDDGILTHYTLAYPQMKEYGYNGTIYILTNWSGLFEGRQLINFEQAKELQDNGWEIGSHGLSHKSFILLSNVELDYELSKSKEILEKHDLVVHSISFPFGYFNEKVIEQTKRYYDSSRPLLNGYNDLNKLESFNLKSKWVKLENKPKEICSWVRYANNKGLWLILDFHYIGEKEERPWDESIGDFKYILQCINDSGIEVKTISEVINKYGKEN